MKTTVLQDPDEPLTKFRIKKQLYTLFLALVFSFSGSRAVIDLQTSINIQDGLGSASGFVVFGSAIIACLTVAPVFMRRMGPKKSIVFSDIFFLLFILANFYPVFGTMIPASFLNGIADALLFPAHSIFNLFYAKKYAKVSKDKRVQHHLQNFTGKFFGVVYFTRVSGNAISYAVMHIATDGMQTSNVSSLNVTEEGDTLRFCGPNDCQDPNITTQNLSKYVAPKETIYILLAIYVALELIAISILVFAVNEIDAFGENAKKDVNGDQLMEGVDGSTVITKEQGNCVTGVVKMFTRCLKHIANPYQLLLMTSQFYGGYSMAFVTAEMSRAYVSCMLGVGQVGLSAGLFGAFGGISSYVNGLLAKRIGIRIPLFSAALLDLSIYIFCLKWEPNPSTLWLVYVLCGVCGYSNGIWQTLTNAMCTKYFKKNQDVAFSVWTAFFSAGMALQFGWSIYLCVWEKIYISIVLLFCAYALYGVAEIVYARNERMKRRRSSAKELLKEISDDKCSRRSSLEKKSNEESF